MTATINTSPLSPTLSYEIPELTITASEPCRVSLRAAGGNATLFSQIFHPYNRIIRVMQLQDIIEPYMRAEALQAETFSIEIEEPESGAWLDDIQFSVVFCHAATPHQGRAADLLASTFLITGSCRRLAPGQPLLISAYFAKGESLKTVLRTRFIDTSTGVSSVDDIEINTEKTAAENGVQSFCIAQSQIADLYGYANQDDYKIIDFTLSIGGRSIYCIIDPTLRYGRNSLIFRNSHNALETVTLPGTCKTKTQVESSTATVLGQRIAYDINAEQSFEINAYPLIADETNWLPQLAAAHNLWHIQPALLKSAPEDNPLAAAITAAIKESTCEFDDSDEKPQEFKLTFTHTDTRTVNTEHAPKNRIFQNQFGKPFI